MDQGPLRGDPEAGTLELYAFPMINACGETEMVLEYARDITARKRAEALLIEREMIFRSLFDMNISAILLIDPNTAEIVDANASACSFYGYSKEELKGMKITDINISSQKEVLTEMAGAKSEQRNYFNFRHRLADGIISDVEVYSGPITVNGRSLLCSTVHDISERKEAERERERLIVQLKNALSEIKTLRGLLPICSACKKIRDEKGDWDIIEAYVQKHSEAQFTHGICPDCARAMYPELFKKE
jgi:PAS domain S-box-containing protein